MVWDGIVAIDLFMAGMGAWTFIFAAFACGRDDAARKAKLAAVAVAVVAVGLGALILAVDARGGMMHPLRFVHLIGNLGSVMAWGVIFISLFLVGAIVCAGMMLAKKQPPRALEIVTAVLGLGVSLYTGVLLGTAPAFPLWSLAALPIAFLVSAAYTGYAAWGLATRVAGGGSAAPSWVSRAALVLPVAEAAALILLLAVVSGTAGSGAAAAAASVANLVSGSQAVVFWGGVVAVGLVAPLALAVLRQRQGDKAPAWYGLAEWVCILVGGFAFRYAVVMAAVPIFL